MNQLVLISLAVSIVVLVVTPGSIGRRLLMAVGIFVVLCAALIAVLLSEVTRQSPVLAPFHRQSWMAVRDWSLNGNINMAS